MLPPPPDTSPDLPRLVDFDPASSLYSTISEHDADTWRPQAFSSAPPEAA